MSRVCDVRSLRRVTYENGMAMQETLVKRRQAEEIADQFLLLEHPPIITLGRGGDTANLLAPPEVLERNGVRFYETTRGGDITYHGPGQIVGYPILHLGEGNRDVRKYVGALEEVLIRTAADFGITATREEGKRGIWVGNEKLAAIGVRIARWVTSHGFAFNVRTDLSHFGLITPCGLHGTGVTSIEKLTGQAPPDDLVRQRLISHFGEVFNREMRSPETAPIEIVKVVVHDGDRVLLLHRRDRDFWQPVTGTVEAPESHAATARRELLEETGFDAQPDDIRLEQSFLIDEGVFVNERTFVVRIVPARPPRLDPEEHDDHGWFTFAEAYQKIRWSDDRDSLEAVESMLHSAEPCLTHSNR